ncbi:alpha/beta hydrolase [Zhihengliuella salsuginis]|uniref:DUF1023 domain-containing protein n=1 Tax=Zhihengliuella salsuginis TaxID=578222 RepID=A0ABQ3GB25_9MICC|nr:alpha/beta hydrolase [Zhihengliuella salsuginis]GHD00271.1 hypothetical protein GCM10008096_03350 [Zhihengliuella salsuginis]
MSIFSIDTSGLKNLPADTEGIRTAARAVKSAGQTIEDETTSAKTTWNGIRPLYEGPGEQALATSMAPAVLDAGELVESTTSLKEAAFTLADEIDDLNTRKGTFWDTTVPDQESNYNDNYADSAASRRQYPHAKATLQQELQRDFDAITEDWETAQTTFNSTVDGIARISSDTPAHFDYGTNSTRIDRAARLYRVAMGEGATAEDVEAYYAYLGKLSDQEIEAFAATHPDSRTAPPPVSAEPPAGDGYPAGKHGADWWDSLSTEQQAALTAMLPALVGNTNGVPYSDRNRANVTTLKLVRNDPDYTAEQREAFESIAKSLHPEEDRDGNTVPRGLLHFIPVDPASQRPLASVAVGDVDTADNVTFTVAGMGSGTNNMTGEVGNAQNLYDGLEGSRAVVSWIGYDSPDKPAWDGSNFNGSWPSLGSAAWESGTNSTEVLRSDHANTGGTQLAIFLDGFHETRDHTGDVPTVNVGAHSYGTTTAAVGLTETKYDVDRFVMYGSAGIDPSVADHASDFNVKEGSDGKAQVYATLAYDDPWAPAGQIGSERLSPTAEEFGAHVFSSDGEGNIDGQVGNIHYQDSSDGDGDWGYLEPDSQSYNTIDQILSGEADAVEYIDEARQDSDPKRVYELMQDAIDAKNTTIEVKEDVVEWFGDRKDDAVEAKDAVVDWTGDRKDDVVDFAGEAKDEVVDRADDARDAAGDAWDWAKDKFP